MEASITSTKNFVWIGNNLAEERDENNNVTRRFYPQGEQISGANYYYTRDQLGSIRELVDSTQAIRARYDYDPYGNRTKLGGDLDAEFGYTGHYYHQPSNLYLTLYRGYDPIIGRWLSRDPIGEDGGINLYRYVSNDSLRLRDALGLTDEIDEPFPGEDGTLGTQRGSDLAKQAPKIVSDTVADGIITVATAVVPGGKITEIAEGAIAKLIQWGWSGARPWLRCVKTLQNGGTVEELAGKIPTLEEAKDLLNRGKCTIDRIQDAHVGPNPHTYPHINYTTPSGNKGTVQVQPW